MARLARIAVALKGEPPARLEPLALAAGLPAAPLPLDMPLLAISGTDVRARVAAGKPIRYLVPPAVADYIAEHRLYRAGGTLPVDQEPGPREL